MTLQQSSKSSSEVELAIENAKMEYGRPYHPSMVIVTQNEDEENYNNYHHSYNNHSYNHNHTNEGSPLLLPQSDPKKLKRLFLNDNDSIMIRPRIILKVMIVLTFVISLCTLTGIVIHRSKQNSHVVVHHHHTTPTMNNNNNNNSNNNNHPYYHHTTTTTTSNHNNDHHPHVNNNDKDVVSIAHIGNSIQYFNDFPRFLETIGHGRIIQNSCLHGGASISSLLIDGNAMYPQFETYNALIGYDITDTDTDVVQHDTMKPIYDYGACTVSQLLLGYDERIHDPGYAISHDEFNNTNPCRVDTNYLHYSISTFEHHTIIENHTKNRDFVFGKNIENDDETTTPITSIQNERNNNNNNNNIDINDNSLYVPHYPKQWDYVIINDNTMNAARGPTREHAMATIERFYVPYLQQSNAIPIFIWTHAYTPVTTPGQVCATTRDMTGLEDIGNFTSLTRVGYQDYIDLLELYLPYHQRPKLAPVGLAFLAVYDDNRTIWEQLFHCDGLHPSPSGTFLQGCIVYYTIFNKMPDYDIMIRTDIESLWNNARMMQHYWEPSNPYPTIENAKYLYNIAKKIMIDHYIPPSYIHYTNHEIAYTGDKTFPP